MDGVTVHVSALTRAFVLQVGDRLVTQGPPGSARPWDPYANKTIVVLARNGTLVVSYAGLAHMQSKPTDQWLAEAITGRSFVPGPTGNLTMGFDTTFHITVRDVTRSLIVAVERDLPQEAASRRIQGLHILITGWVWKRRAQFDISQPRPVALIMRHSGKPGTSIQQEALPRFWRWDKTSMLAVIGAGLADHKAHLLKELSRDNVHFTDKDYERLVVAAIRNRALDSTGDVVGKDCMTVSIGRSQALRIRFSRYANSDSQHTAYTPFVLGRGFLFPPLLLTGQGFSLRAGELSIPIESDPPLTEQGRFITQGQPRRPYPGQ
ncbi:MAG: hypothetical protein ACJ74O_06755 [Frankiaceae bacterium]